MKYEEMLMMKNDVKLKRKAEAKKLQESPEKKNVWKLVKPGVKKLKRPES
jgi:hypothetical protein